MANEYLYGAFGHIGETVAQSAVQAGTVPVYVGVAPVNLVRGYAEQDVINVPTKISNFVDAQKKQGYAADWSTFTLCEAFAAHFDNTKGNIGPIYAINVLDPDVHRKAEATTKTLTFTNGRTEFSSSTIILDTFVLANKVEGVDFTLDYSFVKGSVIVSSADPDRPLTDNLSATFYEVEPGKIAEGDIIGGATAAGNYSGLGAITLLYQEQFQVANLIAAPGWSHIPAVYNAMIKAGTQINGHWNSFCVGDIPLVDGEIKIDTIEKAKAWRRANGYTNERTKVYWPQAIDNTGRVFHLSTMAMVEFMRTDYTHNSIPMETCGNKEIPVVRQYFGPDNKSRGFDQEQAKELTQNGICTAIAWGGRWVLWGDHTAAYTYGADVDPRAIFDVSMRMLMHITNDFQREWSPKIDEPMTLQLRDRIVNREQEKLDGYVAVGALIGEPRILFLQSENSTTDLMNGDFRWDIAVTPTPPLKSASVYVAYTDAGFSAYFEEVA